MRFVTKLALGLAVSGLAAANVWAAGGTSSGAPGLLPLPEISTSWASEGPTLQPAGYSQPAIPAPIQPPAPPKTNATYPSVAPKANDVYDVLQPSTAGCTVSSANGGCDTGCCCGPTWYFGADGLVMTRNQPNKYWTTYDQSNNNLQILNTEQANVHWDGGAEFTLGYRFCCEGGIEAKYWGIFDMNGSASISSATNNLGTPLDTTNGAGNLLLGGQTPDSFFTNAHQVFIWRHDDVHNVEINYTYNPNAADDCASVHSTWLAGFRLFRFNENLLWTSVAGGFNYGSGGGVNQANLNVQTENLLCGFQIGSHVDWRLCDRLSLTATPTMGIFGNHAESDSHYYRGDGVNGFDISGAKDTVSFIGQLDLGLKYDMGCHWSAVAGYRVMVATGVALADNQIPHFLAAADEFADVKVNGELVLHGVYAGVQCCW